jgi:hypothetical protein
MRRHLGRRFELMFRFAWQNFLQTTDDWGLAGFLVRLAIGVGVVVVLYRAFFRRQVDFSIVSRTARSCATAS